MIGVSAFRTDWCQPPKFPIVEIGQLDDSLNQDLVNDSVEKPDEELEEKLEEKSQEEPEIEA